MRVEALKIINKMKTLKLQKRIAAKILGIGINNVFFEPERITEIKDAITRQDVEDLIKDKAIKKRPIGGNKRRSGKIRDLRRIKGRKRGVGKKRKRVGTRKRDYINRIRKIRTLLKHMKDKKEISSEKYNSSRKLAKASVIKTKRELINYLKENK